MESASYKFLTVKIAFTLPWREIAGQCVYSCLNTTRMMTKFSLTARKRLLFVLSLQVFRSSEILSGHFFLLSRGFTRSSHPGQTSYKSQIKTVIHIPRRVSTGHYLEYANSALSSLLQGASPFLNTPHITDSNANDQNVSV